MLNVCLLALNTLLLEAYFILYFNSQRHNIILKPIPIWGYVCSLSVNESIFIIYFKIWHKVINLYLTDFARKQNKFKILNLYFNCYQTHYSSIKVYQYFKFIKKDHKQCHYKDICSKYWYIKIFNSNPLSTLTHWL